MQSVGIELGAEQVHRSLIKAVGLNSLCGWREEGGWGGGGSESKKSFVSLFSKFPVVFKRFWKCSDVFYPIRSMIRTCSDLFRCIQKPSAAFGRFQNFKGFLCLFERLGIFLNAFEVDLRHIFTLTLTCRRVRASKC